jgi:hypothetical protein
MTMHENVSGTWKLVTSAAENVSSVWKQILSGYENVSGTWKRFFTVVTLSGEAIDDTVLDPSDATAALRVDADGNVYSITSGAGTVQLDSSTDWIRPTTLASVNFEVQATLNSGSLAGGTTGSWLTLDTDRAWSVAATAPGSQSANLTIEIRYASGPTLASNTYTLNATVL